jgi:5-formyltetrahydrofolate cyclo-ligase
MTAAADIDEAKSLMRREATSRRREVLVPGDSSERLIGNLLSSGAVPAGACVSGFWPIGSEIDLRPLLKALAARGHMVALPVVA